MPTDKRSIDGGQVDFHGGQCQHSAVTAEEIIREIEAMPPAQQAAVIRFAYQLDAERRLTGPELSELAGRMTRAEDPAEALVLREETLRGFYGGRPNA